MIYSARDNAPDLSAFPYNPSYIHPLPGTSQGHASWSPAHLSFPSIRISDTQLSPAAIPNNYHTITPLFDSTHTGRTSIHILTSLLSAFNSCVTTVRPALNIRTILWSYEISTAIETFHNRGTWALSCHPASNLHVHQRRNGLYDGTFCASMGYKRGLRAEPVLVSSAPHRLIYNGSVEKLRIVVYGFKV